MLGDNVHKSARFPKAAVIGAGVVGRCIALSLQARGYSVAMFDPDREADAASWGNAGHIATEQVEPLASPATLRSVPRRLFAFGGALDVRNPSLTLPWLLRFVAASTPARFENGRRAMRPLLARALPAWQKLASSIGVPGLVRGEGHLVAWESARSAQRGIDRWRSADTGTATFEAVDAATSGALSAMAGDSLADAVRFKGTAQVADPLLLASALLQRFERQGGKYDRRRVRALEKSAGRALLVADDGERIEADIIVVCAGVQSRGLIASVGEVPPLIAERGYHVQWRDHDWPVSMPPVVFEDRSMIVTRFEGGLRASSFVEFAADDAPPDPRKWRRIESHVRELGLPVRGEPSYWQGARPTLPDYLPAIGRSRFAANLVCAFGHQHLGLTLAAVTAELIGSLVAREPTMIDCTPFDPGRFDSSSARVPAARTRPG